MGGAKDARLQHAILAQDLFFVRAPEEERYERAGVVVRLFGVVESKPVEVEASLADPSENPAVEVRDAAPADGLVGEDPLGEAAE